MAGCNDMRPVERQARRELAGHIKQAREIIGYCQEYCAYKSGVSPRTFQRVEQGHRVADKSLNPILATLSDWLAERER